MRVILDTNVIVSGIFFSGSPAEIFRAIKRKTFIPIVSNEIADEYKFTVHKLANKFPNIDADVQLELFILSSEICHPKKPIKSVCKDPDDDMFIACALASQTRIIVSGDKHLLDVSGYEGLEILKPKQFVDKYL